MPKILLVDDDKQTCLQVSQWLGQEMHVVEACTDGEDGMYRALNFSYDIIVLDWEMPNIDCFSP